MAKCFKFSEDLECSEWSSRTTRNTQTSQQSPLGVFAILGGLDKFKILALPPNLNSHILPIVLADVCQCTKQSLMFDSPNQTRCTWICGLPHTGSLDIAQGSGSGRVNYKGFHEIWSLPSTRSHGIARDLGTASHRNPTQSSTTVY